MKTRKPRISMLILTYNRAQLVDRSINSVLNQSFRDFEIVIVDNGSTDNTPEVLKKYEGRKNVRLFRIEKNIGFARGYNFCLDQIGGEWFAVVGDDDEIKEHALEKLFNLVDHFDPGLTAVNCNGIDSATGTYSGLGLYKDQYLDLETIVSKCDGDFWGITRTELIENKRLNPDLPGLENAFWYKVDAIAKRYYLHEPLITYYTDHGVRETAKQSADLHVKTKLYKELLNEPFFWEVLRKYNRRQYLDRCLKAMCFLKMAGEQDVCERYKNMLSGEKPGLKLSLYSVLIEAVNPSILYRLYASFLRFKFLLL